MTSCALPVRRIVAIRSPSWVGSMVYVRSMTRAGRGIDAELLLHQSECALIVEVARDHEDRVVRLIVLVIERLELLDRNVLDVALRADRQVAVGVEEIRCAQHALQRHNERAVLILLELVPHDRHLLLEILAGDEAVRHAVRLEIQRPRRGCESAAVKVSK